jgi:Na+/H+ antiporter NhaA
LSATVTTPRRRELVAQAAAPLRRFLATEAGSAGVMVVAVLVALVWANSPFSDSYESLWHTDLAITLGDLELAMDLEHWVGDGLMALFFLVIGLEVRRELSMGQLTDRRLLIVPVLAGLGGMVVPAALYLLLAPSGAAADGWGVVIATDTALVLGAMAIFGPALNTQLRIFLLSVSVVDDVVAVAIIGVVYSDTLDPVALAVAGGAIAVIAVLAHLGVWRASVYAVMLLVCWVATVESGLHPAIAGMLAGLLIGAHPPRLADVERASELFRAFRQAPLPGIGNLAGRELRRTVSVNDRLQVALLPVATYVIVPLFVLANAGIDLRGGVLGDALASPVTWAIVAGLAGGKLVGIGVTSVVAARAGVGALPQGVGEGQVLGGAALSGIGFTVSLLIANLAFTSPELLDAATVGVLLAALVATAVGAVTFRIAAVIFGERTAALPMKLAEPVDPARDHIRGPVDAPLTLVEYADFQCPFCGRATGAVDALRERFGDELRYVFRHLPLPDVHPDAELAAEAAEAAGAQGRFWEMHDRLFAHQDELDPVSLFAHASAIGLDLERFSRDLGTGIHAAHVRQDAASADAGGAGGTPTFFVNGVRQVGRYDEEALAAALTGGTPPPAPQAEPVAARAVSGVLPAIGRLRDLAAEPAPLVLDGLEETPDDGGYPRLDPAQIAQLAPYGERRRFEAGEPLYDPAHPSTDFVVVLDGAVAVVDGYGHENRVRAVHGARRFLGGLGVLRGEAMVLTPVAQRPSEILAVPGAALQTALDASPDLRETILRTFLLRRSYVLSMAALQVVGRETSTRARALREFLTARDVLYSWLDVDADQLATDVLRQLEMDADETPVVITRDRRVLRNPSTTDLAAELGLEI